MAALLYLVAHRPWPRRHRRTNFFHPDFPKRVCSELLFAKRKPTSKRLVKQYLLSIGQVFASVGADDPHHNRMGKLDFRLGRQMESYKKEHSTLTRVRPLPVNVIQALDTAAQGTTPRNTAISNLTWVAFCLLLRHVEYCKGGTDNTHHLFRLKEVQLFIGYQPYNAATATNNILTQADFVSLIFTTNKNGVKADSIRHGITRHPQEYPVAAMHFRVEYLQHNGATGNMPIPSIKIYNKWQQIRGDKITSAIKSRVRTAGPFIGFIEAGISAHSICAVVAMALLIERVDPDNTRLVRRWRSDTMICYLHTTAKSFI